MPPAVPTLLSVAKVAEVLDCDPDHVYNLISDGELSKVNIARGTSTRPLTKVRTDDLADYINRRTTNAKRLRTA
jgi:hypothetical protein